jgi:hypothetical protein
MSESRHYATSNLGTAFSPWPLESLAPGKVRQDPVNGQRPKAASFTATADLVDVELVKLMALRLHPVMQSLVLELPSTGSKQQLPKLRCEYPHQLLLSHDLGLPIREVVLG